MNKLLKLISLSLVLCFLSIISFAQPDLSIDRARLIRDLRTDLLDNTDPCYINEGCVGGYGARQLIKFTTYIKNVGNQDFVVGAPPRNPSLENEIWEWDECHRHWHYESYARYILYDQNGNETPAGFKNGFCLMDSECSGGGRITYSCTYQGISAGCGDVYSWSLPCQWIDVTDIPSGIYRLVNQVNWLRSPDYFNNSEVNYSNNEASVCLRISRDSRGRHLINILPDNNCSCTDNDSDGVCAIDDCNDNNSTVPAPPGTTCNDNNSNTINDRILTDGCTCQGTIISCTDADNDGICANEDCNDNNPSLPAPPGTNCNDNNPTTSNDIILADGCTCGGTSNDGETRISCGQLTITYGSGEINMVGSNNYKFKIHDLNNGWGEVFSCVANCGSSQTAVLPNGFYKIKIYNFNWSVVECEVDIVLTNTTGTCPDADNDGVCAASDCNDNNPRLPAVPGTPCSDNNSGTSNDIILADGCTCRGTPISCTDLDGDGVCAAQDCNDNNATIPTTPGTPCNDNNSNTTNDIILADGCTCRGTTRGSTNGTTIDCGEITIVYGSGQIAITGNTGSLYRFKIHDLNNAWSEVLNCATENCGSSQTASLPNGLYKVKIYDTNWAVVCDQDIDLAGGNGGSACTDADGDGICAAADCNDNNPTIPTTPGSSCNDNNSNTTNDVILSDGCTCRGTTSSGGGGSNTGTCSDINITTSGTTINIAGLTASIEILKVYRINNGWQLIHDCIANCGAQQTIPNLIPGNYIVEIQFFSASWAAICSEQKAISISSLDREETSTPSFLTGKEPASNSLKKPIKFDLYPNPAQEKIWVNLSNWDKQAVELKIVNHLAQTVVQHTIQHQEGMVHPIEVPNLSNGLHFVQISNGRQTLTKKILIAK